MHSIWILWMAACGTPEPDVSPPPPVPQEPAAPAKQVEKRPPLLSNPGEIGAMGGPVIFVDGAKGCHVEIDGTVVDASRVQGGGSEGPASLPLRFKTLERGTYTFKVVGDAPHCQGHEELERIYDGRLVIQLPFTGPDKP